MKKLSLLFIGICAMTHSYAQEISDAVRYSQDEIQGSARFRAMGGAFGALGGEMSAVSLNPAGSAIFNRSHASFSLSNLTVNNDVSFFEGRGSSSESKFDLNQVGAAFVFNNTDENSPWKKFTLSFAYDKTGNFDNNWSVRGTNTRSIDNYFLSYAENLRLDEISAFEDETLGQAYSEIGSFYGYGNQQAFLGYESFILEPDEDTDANTSYTSNISGDRFNQGYSKVETGYNGKMSFNAATQYGEHLYFGLNLNAHFISYERFSNFTESNSNENSLVTNVDFENSLFTTGNGFSFQLGTIIKLTNDLRAGLTYQSPTWYTIAEETTQYLSTVISDDLGTDNIVINPNIINIFPDYKLQTPGKITGSLAYVFGTKGLLSFDYSRKDYSNTKFKPTSDLFFSTQNSTMNDILQAANTYRVGGEYRYKQISFRGGYRFEESPYVDNTFYGDLTGYSLGLGYSFGSTRLDLTYDRSERTIDNQLFSRGLTSPVTLDNTNSNITLSLGFDL
ncbi:OmpP1/FadL family transporter [Sediminibacter sp. Hel_I_10]|uniref:OmpP1/FadL family transporter n=1 Tax=Sediminibacter sp. Hel_I_10 TaxID=1392490 RepID=UPI0004790AFE|nr:outer membrane protein transport protein [Sediminibacter sp. Hel_I_10]